MRERLEMRVRIRVIPYGPRPDPVHFALNSGEAEFGGTIAGSSGLQMQLVLRGLRLQAVENGRLVDKLLA